MKQCCQQKLSQTLLKFLISKGLIDSYVKHEEFVLLQNVLREYNEMKEEFKNPENAVDYAIQEEWKRIVPVVRKILRTNE